MEWIHDYQLFLFDFDGLLVNTEEIHYRAYKKMCADRGFTLSWDFTRYCFMAHYDSELLKETLLKELPDLKRMEPDWNVLYAEKKRAMIELLNQGQVHLMPGVADFLNLLAKENINRCVVTHSPNEQIQIIKKQNPILQTIPHWFTRETYTHPKPHPECYLNAIKKLAADSSNVIGFEDTPRGLTALMQTRAKPVIVSKIPYPEIPQYIREGALHFPSFEALPNRF